MAERISEIRTRLVMSKVRLVAKISHSRDTAMPGKRAGSALSLRVTPVIRLTTEEKDMDETSVMVVKKCQFGTNIYDEIATFRQVATTSLLIPVFLGTFRRQRAKFSRPRYLLNCLNKEFSTLANFEKNLSVTDLMWSSKNGISKSL